MEHIDIGMDVVKRAIQDLSGVGRPDDEPKLNGRFIMVNLSPLPQNKRILKYNSVEEAESEVEEEDDSENLVEDLAEE